MMDMVERVARAILAAHDHTTNDGAVGGFETMTPDWQDTYRAMARAAIEAMREPTTAMTGAIAFGSYTTFSYGGDENSFEYISAENAAEIWRDMISAALSA